MGEDSPRESPRSTSLQTRPPRETQQTEDDSWGSPTKPTKAAEPNRMDSVLEEASLTELRVDVPAEDAVCAVCADDRVAYASTTCRHAACEACWRAWFQDRGTCWLCGTPVTHLAPVTIVEIRKKVVVSFNDESPSGRVCAAAVEVRRSTAVLLKALVATKHRAMELSGSMSEVENHLRRLAAREQSADALTAVLAVERRLLATTTACILGLCGDHDFSILDDTDLKLWKDLNAKASVVQVAVDTASTALDALDDGSSFETKSDDEEGLVRSQSDAASLAAAREAAKNAGVDVANAQWTAAKADLELCLKHRLPRLKSLLCGPGDGRRHRTIDVDLFMDARTVDLAFKTARTRLKHLDATFDDLFAALQLLAARLESFFPVTSDDDDEKHHDPYTPVTTTDLDVDTSTVL